MSSIAEVRDLVHGHLAEMERTAGQIMSLRENLATTAYEIRSAVDRATGHSSHISDTEALFAAGLAIDADCTKLTGAIEQMRTTVNSW
ncbi:hypothetical protein ACIRG5_47045 [Lentzea sp. NPDC102401]|uniref:hypothetical protein n=1 Tax=Lentzea sp. NPDC102401 TaxID=3364128 RepID=UPI0037FA6869